MTIDPDVAEIGVRVRDLRLALGMTLVTLSERCGVTPNYLGTIERGQRDPGLRIMHKVAQGLGTTMAELFGGHPPISQAALDAAHLLEEATPDLQEAIEGLLRALGRVLVDPIEPPRPKSRRSRAARAPLG